MNRTGKGRSLRALIGVIGVATLAVMAALPARRAGAAVVVEGTILVADNGASLVQRIDPATDTVTQTISHPDFAGNSVQDVDIDNANGNIYVAVDLLADGFGGAAEVVVFDPFGAFLLVVPLPADLALGNQTPWHIDVDIDGSVWASQTNGDVITHVALNGTVLHSFPVAAGAQVTGVTVSADGFVYYVTFTGQQLRQVEVATGTDTLLSATVVNGLSVELPDPKSAPNPDILRVTGIDPNTAAGAIETFDRTGAPMGLLSTAPGITPEDSAQRNNGNVFVAMFDQGQVNVYDASLVFQTALTGGGTLVNPWGVDIAGERCLRYTFNTRFGTACPGDSVERELTVTNICGSNVTILDVANVAGSPEFSVDPDPALPLVLPPGARISFLVRFDPALPAGLKTATIRVTSNDSLEPVRDFTVSGTVGAPNINRTGGFNYGDVCLGGFKDLPLEVHNTGRCDLTITGIDPSATGEFFLPPGAALFPFVLSPNASATFPVRFEPASAGPASGTITINSDDPDTPALAVDLIGTGAVPDINVSPAALGFGQVCVGVEELRTLQVHNTSECTLTVADIALTAGSTDFSVVPPQFPFVLSANSHVDVQIAVNASAQGPISATFTVTSDDPDEPALAVEATADAGPGDLNVSPTTLVFGEVCIGDTKTLPVELINQGGCTLNVTSIARVAGSDEFEVANPQLPLVLSHDASVPVNITFTPVAPFGIKTATFEIASDDPDEPVLSFVVEGTVGTPDIRVQNCPLDFGTVPFPANAEAQIQICNVGRCDLNVTQVAFVPPTADFQIVEASPTPGSPLVVSKDFCIPFHVRFTPTSAGLKVANIQIISDDPDQPVVDCPVTGNTLTASLAALDVPAGIAFRPTVIQQHGNCFTDAVPAISNNGIGVVAISNVALTGENPGDFELVGLPSQPILLGPGDVLGGGGFVVRFRPTARDRDRRADLVLTVVDPITMLPLGDATIPLCGEGVRPGGRVLILKNGAPAPKVKRLILERLQEEDGPRGDFEKIWERTNVAPKTVTPGAPCLPFTYHAEWGGIDSIGFPGYLRPARYRVKATVRVNGKDRTKFINFEVTECTFNDGLFLLFP